MKTSKTKTQKPEILTTDQELEKVRIATKLKHVCTLKQLIEFEKLIYNNGIKIA